MTAFLMAAGVAALALVSGSSQAASIRPGQAPDVCTRFRTVTRSDPLDGAARAQERRWWQRPRATGTWGGARESLEERGLVFLAAYTFDGSTVVSGSADRRGAGRGLLSVGIGVDLLRLVGWRGASFFAGAHALRGPNGSDSLGDIQGYSNIDAGEFETLAELWLEQRLLSERLRLKIGRIDANTEFAWVGAGGEFINSSAGYSPTILFLPTYPNPAPSINLFYRPTGAVRLGVGVYERGLEADAGASGSRARFTIGEAGVTGDGPGILGPWRVALGVWRDDAAVTAFDGSLSRSTSGFYALAEQRFAVSPSGRWIDAFVQLGHADQAVGEFANHWSGGLVTPSPFRGRRGDLVGAMLSVVDLSDAPAAEMPRNESVLEVFYAIPVAGFVRVKPDLQFVSNPNGESRSALVGTLRVELSF